MNKTVLIGIIVIVLLGLGAWWVWSQKQNGTPPGEATSTEATGTSTSTPEQESDTGALNQRIYSFGVHITPLVVLQDSRCPTDVQCIQAGAVTLKVLLEDGTNTQTINMITGSPVAFGNKHVTLMSVTPAKNSKISITPDQYRFTFSVAYGMGGDAP